MTDDPDEWRALAATRSIVGRGDLASAVLFAPALRVDVMTDAPSWYAGIAGGRRVLEFED